MSSGMPLKYTQGEDPCMMLCPVPFRTTKAGEDFLLWQSSSRHILVFATGSNIRLLADRRALGMDGTFTVLPQWYQQLFTIHEICGVYAGAGSLPFMYGATSQIRGYRADTSTSARWYIKKSVSCGLKTRYRTEIETKRKIRMLLATAFLPVPQVDTGVRLLEAGTTGWHNQFNKKAGGNKLGLYRLLHYLEEEQGVMEMLINQLLSRNSAAGSIRQISSRCAEKQQRFIIYTDEYTSGRRTLEPHARADLIPPSKLLQQEPTKIGLQRTNRNDKYWMCTERSRGCRGTLSTNLEATEVIRSREHAESCLVNPHAFYHYQQLADGGPQNIRDLKDLPMYSRIFEVLFSKEKELGAQLNPAKFVCDFETDFNFCQAGLA
ncbi:hypothetical protein T05_8968 [Trichinella murrelli]|uniref:Uncharacterized protein n=1 Tax=Trichinella murrelli TaxID=144512 RepID=A0A0V0TBF4_9BILA|nr:hypothetical protein T05_8968 [Trichinella murrelli]